MVIKTINQGVDKPLKKVKKRLRFTHKRIVRSSLIIFNMLLLIGITGFVFVYKPSSDTTVRSNSVSAGDTQNVDPLDKISSADIAVSLAQLARLDEITAVINYADSRNATLEIQASDPQIVTKPQIVKTDLKTKQDVVTHTVAEGETLANIAERFGVTSDSIRWSNNLTSTNVAVGLNLQIPPIEGIVYKVKSGETAEVLATRFRSDQAKIVAFNDAEIHGLVEGDTIVIPNGQIVAVAPRYSIAAASYAAGSYSARFGGNGYDYGWCTWHAANRRLQNGQSMPSNLGNAITWYSLSQRSGLPVGNEPRAGAILWHANLGGLGHVAYVESMNEDGSALVSDMNYPIWGTVTYRTISPGEFSKYRFIY